MFAATCAWGAADRYELTIKSGLPLDEALQELARQSGAQLVFFSQVTAGLQAPQLSGEYTLEAAMTSLLAGSGLTFRLVNASTVQVRQPPKGSVLPRANARSRSSPRPPAAVGEPMEEVRVVGTAEQLVATRVPTPLIEIPQTLSIISGEQMRQQNDVDLADVLRYAPGIATRRRSSLDETFYSRAFEIISFHVDGGGALKPLLPSGIQLYEGAPDLSEFDHVEVLRGSDALFTGNGNPGGTVSLVRKRPLRTSRLDVSATVGSWNTRRLELDATGPLTDDGALRGRADAVYSRHDYFFRGANLERQKIFGVLEYDFTPEATLTWGGSFQRDDALPFTPGLPLYTDGSDPDLPRDTSYVFDWAFQRTRQAEAYVQYRQQFAEDWNVRLNASAGRIKVEYATGAFTSPINKNSQFMGSPTANFTTRPNIHKAYSVDLTLTGSLEWFGMRGELAIGGDFTRLDAEQITAGYFTFGQPLRDPRNFDRAAYPDPRGRPFDLEFDGYGTLEQYGVFGSLRVDLNDAWSVTAGGRVASDTLRTAGVVGGTIGSLLFPSAFVKASSGSDSIFTPFGALMYRFNEHYSWYASYADIYLSQTPDRARVDGSHIEPSHGVNIESGIKGAWRGGALNGSLAVYRIRQGDVAVPDTQTNAGVGSCCYLTDTAPSYGAEAEINGELVPDWLIGAGYAYDVSRSPNERGSLTATPRHLLKIWTSTLLPGDLSRWTVGGSVRAQTKPRGTFLTTCSISMQTCEGGEVVAQRSYAVFDLRAAFQIDPTWQIALSANNAFDKRYFLSQNSPALTVWYGEPRNFMLRFDGNY